MNQGYNDRLRAYIEAAILDQAPTWESLFDSGPGQVVSVSDAALVAAMAASRFRLLYEAADATWRGTPAPREKAPPTAREIGGAFSGLQQRRQDHR